MVRREEEEEEEDESLHRWNDGDGGKTKNKRGSCSYKDCSFHFGRDGGEGGVSHMRERERERERESLFICV